MMKYRPDYELSNSYSTMNTKGLREKMGKVGVEVKKIVALNGSDTDKLEKVGDRVIAIKGELDSIPAFAHPYFDGEHCIIDARAYVNREGQIKDYSEYALLVRRAKAEHGWIMDNYEFGSQADLVVDCFASWFANGIAKRSNMSALENQQLRVLAAIYYLRMLHRVGGLNVEDTQTNILKTVPRILSVPATVVDDVISACDPEDIQTLYLYEPDQQKSTGSYLAVLEKCFNQVTDNAYRLNATVIFASLTRGAFISANSPEITAVAIEHPPTLFVMIWYGLQKGIHGKTTLGLTVNGIGRRHDVDKFNKFMLALFGE